MLALENDALVELIFVTFNKFVCEFTTFAFIYETRDKLKFPHCVTILLLINEYKLAHVMFVVVILAVLKLLVKSNYLIMYYSHYLYVNLMLH